ncbi:hypothetical protein U5640_16930 [Streptomyces sp. SS7]|uniref:hypothetical protein n=1 Tax=Streptomyces sp. SS7 TaxID=3108485 RepID=UPI0030EECF83
MSKVEFQVAWCESTPGEVHVTFSGHMTPCDKRVFEASPVYASKLKDVTCEVCGAYVLFDMEAARKAAEQYVTNHAGTAKWSDLDRIEFAGNAMERAAGVAFRLKRERGEWNSNMAFSEFMAGGGWMTDKSPEAGLIGMTAIAVFDNLKEREAE